MTGLAEPRGELDLQSTLGHAFMFTERNSEQAESALEQHLHRDLRRGVIPKVPAAQPGAQLSCSAANVGPKSAYRACTRTVAGERRPSVRTG